MTLALIITNKTVFVHRRSNILNKIGELKHSTMFGLQLPQIGDIYEAESEINGQKYRCKVFKIKKLECVCCT